VISFSTQSAGAAILTGAKDDEQKRLLGQHVLMGRLGPPTHCFWLLHSRSNPIRLKMQKLQQMHATIDTQLEEWPNCFSASMPAAELHINHA